MQGFRLQVHPYQPQDGPTGGAGRPAHRPDHPATLPAAAQWAHTLGGPLRGVLPYRRGWLHLRPVRVAALPRRDAVNGHRQLPLRKHRVRGPHGGQSHQLQGGTDGAGQIQSLQSLQYDDCVQLKRHAVTPACFCSGSHRGWLGHMTRSGWAFWS